jgi:GntR family transcriptional regulator, transcriptional repressor for pyruvate dehydrogenase complex
MRHTGARSGVVARDGGTRAGPGFDRSMPPTYGIRVTAVRRAVPAYQMLADTLRVRILTRELLPGQKLPIEPDLAEQYGVSRSTVREALRVLASQGLVSTSRGMQGGSFISCPEPAQISDYLHASLSLLAESEHVGIDALLEARDMLEVPAAGLAALRRTPSQLKALRATLYEPAATTVDQRVALSREFHEVTLQAAGNLIVESLVGPIFRVLYERLAERVPVPGWAMEGDHQLIFDAIAAGDAEAARAEMQIHLRKLRLLSRQEPSAGAGDPGSTATSPTT